MTQPSKLQVDQALTRKVADLARLDLTDSEVQTFTQQLGDILKYIDLLSQAQVTTANGQPVEPLTHPLELTIEFRDDQVVPSLVDSDGKPKILRSAPDTLYDGFKVPQIV